MRTLLLTLTTCLLILPAHAKYSGGTGEPNDPYQIATAADLIALGETPADYDKHFILTADIDLDPNLPGRKVFRTAVIAPTPNVAFTFTGVFDTEGHTISHLRIEGSDFLGLFGCLSSGAEVKNLGVVDVDIASSGGSVGGLVGRNWEGQVIQCYSTGAVRGSTYVGGLAGYSYGPVAQCYSTGAVGGSSDVGGLVGHNEGPVTQCYSTGAVSGSINVGGLVGYNWGPVTQCYAIGAVSGTMQVGGLVGHNEGYVSVSFWDTQTSGQAKSAAGTGKTTGQMRDIQTYLGAGWDFVGETENGVHEAWQMPEGGGYPVLAIFHGYTPPRLRGQGTPEDPYLISSTMELGAMVHYSPSAHYRLVASIDLSGIGWGTAVVPWFVGTFDGNNLTISHLTINGVEYLGLFGQLEPGAKVKSVAVVDVNIAGSGAYVGALVGDNWADVTQCYSTGVVSGTGWYVGGLIGENSATVTQCYSSATVTGSGRCVGGLVGRNCYSTVANCYSTGAVSGTSFVGGLVGHNYGSTLIHSYSTGLVTGSESVGGLVGDDTRCERLCWHTGSVTWSFWDMQTSGKATSVGGTGKTTAEMKAAKTFLDAGWDFVGETANGTEDLWWVLEGKDHPRLWWELNEEETVNP